MADKKENQNEAERWKEKYFLQIEEFDQQEASLTKFIDLLQRGLVRVSLAAEGIDKDLDTELEGLRDQLHSGSAAKTELAVRLEKIEKAVLRLDEQKHTDSNSVLQSLESLVDQLLNMDLNRDKKKQLKRLSNNLKGKQSNLKDYPDLLSQYARLQASALQEKFTEKADKNTGGILQRFFGRTSEDFKNKDIASDENFIPFDAKESKQKKPDQADSAYAKGANYPIERSFIQQETELDITIDDQGNASVPGFSTISKHISSALRNLIDQLTLPDGVETEVQRLQNHIENGLNWYELGPTLDDVANLVISAVSRAQNDFEGFLKGLDDRLAKLQSYLLESHQQQLGWKGNSHDLDTTLRSQVSSISREVADATDLKQLKVSVEVHLDTIIQSMDSFRLIEDKREQESVAQVKALNQRLQAMEGEASEIRERLRVERNRALTDVLTQIPNREAFEERMAMEFERWARYRQPTSLVVADIDLFKRVNDEYGHLAGDKVLQIIAKEIKSRIRKTDFLARYGGEEFVIIMPETDINMAETVIEKTREMVARLPFHFREEDVKITLSFGIVSFQEGDTALDLFEVADQALYQAKNRGRNCVVVGSREAGSQ